MKHSLRLCTILFLLFPHFSHQRWTAEKAQSWYQTTGPLIGSNYIPSYAVNQLEFWQADTFNLTAISSELDLAASLGFTSLRVFLHNLVWSHDEQGLFHRMELFLNEADRRGIGIVFVFFDSCWDPNPRPGRQREPIPHVHNSRWVQSPGDGILTKPDRYESIKSYVQAVIRHFQHDKRVHAWDLYNEPDNPGVANYTRFPKKRIYVENLLEQVFDWAREIDPSQPLTSSIRTSSSQFSQFNNNNGRPNLSPIHFTQLTESDIISFYSYQPILNVLAIISVLKQFYANDDRPILCTEYMARPLSTFDPILGLLTKQKIGAFNRGFVRGKTNTIYPLDSWVKSYREEPKLWFHDMFHRNGTLYDEKEGQYVRAVVEDAKKNWNVTTHSDLSGVTSYIFA